MNKTSKFLVFTGLLASVTTYLAFKVTHYSSVRDEDSSSSLRKSDNNYLKKEKPDSSKNGGREDKTNSSSADRTQLMYKDLSMTEYQSRRFEEDYQAIMGDWEKNNPGLDIDDQQKENSFIAALKAVLNEDQFAMYREGPNKRRS